MMASLKSSSARGVLACASMLSILTVDCRDEASHVITPAPQPAQTAPTQDPKGSDLPRGVEEPPSLEHVRAEQRHHPTEPNANPPARPANRPEPAVEETTKSALAPSATTPAPSVPPPAQHTRVPSTAHVRVDIPAGMQALLDADSRMQPWVDDVMRIADRCYASELAKSASTAGAIVVEVTMHKDDRPDLDMKSLPPQLAGLVACATGDLMRNRIPLFSGPEGQHHTLAIRFSP